jgi:hypothetical protein
MFYVSLSGSLLSADSIFFTFTKRASPQHLIRWGALKHVHHIGASHAKSIYRGGSNEVVSDSRMASRVQPSFGFRSSLVSSPAVKSSQRLAFESSHEVFAARALRLTA